MKPMEIDEPFSDFIDYLRNQEKSGGPIDKAEKVKYSQAREQKLGSKNLADADDTA